MLQRHYPNSLSYLASHRIAELPVTRKLPRLAPVSTSSVHSSQFASLCSSSSIRSRPKASTKTTTSGPCLSKTRKHNAFRCPGNSKHSSQTTSSPLVKLLLKGDTVHTSFWKGHNEQKRNGHKQLRTTKIPRLQSRKGPTATETSNAENLSPTGHNPLPPEPRIYTTSRL